MRKRENLNRRIVQYGNLVIDGFEMLNNQTSRKSVKETTVDRQFSHGSRLMMRGRNHLYNEQILNVNLSFDTRKLRKEDIRFYKQHVLMELSKPARIWTVEGRQLLHAMAFVPNWSETFQDEPYSFSATLSITIIDGVWSMARQREVFLTEYNPCEFMDCLDIREEPTCVECCICIEKNKDHCNCLCECDVFIRENSLCELGRDVLQDFYVDCKNSYKIHFNCERGRVFNLDEESHATLCKEDACERMIYGFFRTETILATNQVTIVADGFMIDPIFQINNTKLQVLGEFDGRLTIKPNWDVHYHPSECCEGAILLAFDQIVFDRRLGFELSHGVHSFRGDMGSCCGMVCVNIFIDEKTI